MSSPPAVPYWREAGAGPAVVCLHANASLSGQWRPLMSRLADRRRLLAPDSYGAGQSPEWPSDRTITLADEVQLIEPVLAQAGERNVASAADALAGAMNSLLGGIGRLVGPQSGPSGGQVQLAWARS